MKTLTPPPTTASMRSHRTSGPGTDRQLAASEGRSSRPLRRLAVAGAALSLAALGACSSDTSSTAAPSASAATTGSSAGATSRPPTSSTTTTAPPARVDKTVKVEIKDDVLGFAMTATKLSRNIPWPAGNPVAAASFEIVGVEMTVVAGDRYTAEVQPSMFALKAGSSGAIKPTAEFGKTFGAPLATAKRAEKKAGWLFFKVDRGASGALQLSFNRPAYTVSTTGTAIPAKTFSKPIG